MNYKDQIQSSIAREVKIIQHLSSKFSEEDMDYRPNEKMRTTLELLRYLSWCSLATIESYKDEESNQEMRNIYKSLSEKAQEVTLANFSTKMEEQFEGIKKALNSISEEDLTGRNVKVVWGESIPLGEAIINTTIKYLTAYRMQLFLYAKMCVDQNLNTLNCWLGIDKIER